MTSQRRINLLLTVPHLDSTATPYRHMLAIAKHLPYSEFQLSICSLRENGLEQTKPLLLDLHVANVFVARFRPRGHHLRHFKASWQDQKLIEQYGPFDIQHSMDFSALPTEPILARWHHRAFLYTQRNMIHGGHYAAQFSKAHLSNRIITISQATDNLLKKMKVPAYKRKQIYNGIDIEEVEKQLVSGVDKKRGRILFVGHITRNKRQHDAIKAVARLREFVPECTLDLAGAVFDSAYYEELKALAWELKISEHVRFLGVCNNIVQLLQEAEVVILCSEREALPLSLIEAMTVGTPIVASAVDGVRELVEHEKTGLLVEFGDIDGYATALKRIMVEESLADELVTRGRWLLESKFTAHRMVNSLTGVYMDMVHNRI